MAFPSSFWQPVGIKKVLAAVFKLFRIIFGPFPIVFGPFRTVFGPFRTVFGSFSDRFRSVSGPFSDHLRRGCDDRAGKKNTSKKFAARRPANFLRVRLGRKTGRKNGQKKKREIYSQRNLLRTAIN